MIDFFICQIKSFNVLMFILIVLFNSILSRNIISKILKEESKDIYNQFEEIKDTIRDNKK
jgi:hypothetical protein